MAPPTIAQGSPFFPRGISYNKGYLMIHAMAMFIWYKDRMWDYAALLQELGRGVHFAILPCGQVIQHNDPRTTLWHARGANRGSCGVELLVEGVFDLDALYRKIDQNTAAFNVYSREQYDGLLSVMDLLVQEEYVRTPYYNWDTHHSQSGGRKRDPGNSFDFATWIEMLRLKYGE